MLPHIPVGWSSLLKEETTQPYFRQLDAYLDQELARGETILPAAADIFNALNLTPYSQVKVRLLGQDPYPTPGHAHGLCFSVRPHVRPIPGSLRNIFKELRSDVGFRVPNHGNLESWARQGILLLNPVLTVRAHQPQSHRKQGWEPFTDRIIELLDARPARVVFILWGNEAKKKKKLIRGAHHSIIECAHPSPLSARFFLGCRCFSRVNSALTAVGLPGIEWQIPDIPAASPNC